IAGRLVPEYPLSSETPTQIRVISSEFQFLRFYRGVVILPLAVARAADSANIALEWYRGGGKEEEERGKRAFELRQECYNAALRGFEELFAGVPPDFS